MKSEYSHLPHIKDHNELTLYELIPDVVWIFDIDRHGWWWGNEAALNFWGLTTLEQLINKDLSGDTQGARDRTVQTFERAVAEGLTKDPWTTYPNGKAKTLYMKHKAVLVGPEKHRAIIAFVNESVSLGEIPENLLLVEAMRYTKVLVTSFTLSGEIVVENPAATNAYLSVNPREKGIAQSTFAARFANAQQGNNCLNQAIAEHGGRWTYQMQTIHGIKQHTLDIRETRHPLTGEFLLLVVEYDVTDLHQAIAQVEQTKNKLKQMAHVDALTNLPNLRQLEETGAALLKQADRRQENIVIMFIDLDGFKGVNDKYGHHAGDELLKAVASRLTSQLRNSDLIARIGGDEFVLMQANIDDKTDIAGVAQKVIDIISEPFEPSFGSVQLGASIGIARFPDDGKSMESLLKVADHAMYQVKKHNKNGFQFACCD
ncbi:GGDEF domain-containing protein [Thalassotalea sp. G2M2-11]|uniref:GGDEF domain-containing protein n=1 Tax=Thalassotalea sp. G2M2-11 TaxID=2787627 RepID=UPI0019D2F9E9|nr:GGDEF domain-containing protein [Thalassotalea sp. G2M2-11]